MRTQFDLTCQPYYKCLSCPEFKARRCYYPRTSELAIIAWCAFIREGKILFGLSNETIAKNADVSEKTIERIVSLNYDQDIMLDTFRHIERAVFGASSATFCGWLFEEEKRAMEQELQAANAALDAANKELESLRSTVHTLKEDNAYLKSENKLKSKIILIGVNRLNDLLSHD